VELLGLAVIASFLGCGIYLILDRTLLRVVLGLGLLSNGMHLFLLGSGGRGVPVAPILESHADSHGHAAAQTLATIADPLPQALILTSIVISFAVTALLLVLSYRTYEAYGSDDLADLHGRLNDE
jgi:multicomponent Na+:H+ antiporter subunit C